MLFGDKDYRLRRFGLRPNFYKVKIATQFFQIIIAAFFMPHYSAIKNEKQKLGTIKYGSGNVKKLLQSKTPCFIAPPFSLIENQNNNGIKNPGTPPESLAVYSPWKAKHRTAALTSPHPPTRPQPPPLNT
jgi:hypothetical protein